MFDCLLYKNVEEETHADEAPIYIENIVWVLNRNLTVSPCGRSAGTVPESPELDTKDKIILKND